MVDIKKLILRFPICARDLLRRSAWSMLKNRGLSTVFNTERPSAHIGVVDIGKLRLFYDWCA